MTVLNAMMDKIDARLTFVKHRLLGANNERLDFVMDSFYKMEPRQKNFVLAGIVAAIVCFIAFAVFFYIAQIGALETRLNASFAALNTLQEQKTDFGRINGKFNVIVKDVARRTQGLKMKPLLEKFARGLNIKIEGLNEASDAFPSDNPMSKFLEQRKIEVRLPRVSIPKLLKFLVEVEKARKFLRISDLTIRGIYGTKLYFDASAVINWYRGHDEMSKPLQYVCYAILFVVCFLFFVYLTFPFNILKESLVMKLNKATGLNIAVFDMSPSLLLGVEAQGVSLKTATGQEVKFSAIEASLSTWHLFIGRLRCVLEVQDAQENPLEVAAGFGLFSLIANATSGKPPLPDEITIKASNYGLNDLTAYALSSYAGNPRTNPLIVPLLEQMEVRGSLNTDITINLDLEDPTASDGNLNLNIDKFALAMNAPDFTIDDQIFEKALVKANLSGGSLKIQEGSEFSSQDISVRVSGNLDLKTPLPSSVMNLSIPLQIKGALKDQFGFLIDAMLKGTSDGNIPLQVRGTLMRPSVSYN